MKRLAVALALLLAIPANGNTLIVLEEPRSGSNIKGFQQNYQAFTKMLDARGATYKSTHISNTKTLWMRTGLQVWGTFNQATARREQFDAVVIFGWDDANPNPTGATPESLTFNASWPSVPVVFVGLAGTGSGKWASSSTESTGVEQIGAYNSVYRNYVMYPIGTTAGIRVMNGSSIWPQHVKSAQPAGTTFRPLVACNYSATVPGGLPPVNSLLRSYADSANYNATAEKDTVVMWARYTLNAANGGLAANINPKPIIFVDIGFSPPDLGLMAMAMQMADSASGGQVWDAPRAKPIQAALAVTAVASRGKYTNAMDGSPSVVRITHLQGGTFCYADSCDSTNVHGGLDSLGTLAELKTTFFVEPCSLAAYPSVKGWLYRAGKYRVGIQTAAGFGTGTTQIMGAADSTYPIDPLGITRTRVASQPGNESCSQPGDTVYTMCNLLRARNLIRNYFGEGTYDPSIFPAAGDWSPKDYTRTGGGPGVDSMAWVLYKGGVRAVVIRPEWINSSAGVSATFSAGITQLTGATAPAADPYGYGPNTRRIPVFRDPADPASGQIGSLKIVAERGEHGMPNVAPGGYTSHDTRTEWLSGLADDAWYFAPIIGHTHLFYSRTQVLHVSLGRLGGAATSTPARNGWYDVKHTHNAFTAANNLGWVDPVSGKQRAMFQWVYVSELQP